MTSSRTALALSALVLAVPLAACSGGSSTPSATVTVSTPAAPTASSATVTVTTPAAPATSSATVTVTAPATTTSTPEVPSHAVTQTVSESVPAPAPATQTVTQTVTPTVTRTRTASEPALGVAGARPSARGIGEVRPSRVYYGGDPTGDAFGITWDSWGGPTAVGHGYGYWMGPKSSVSESVKTPMTIRAYGLRECGGRLTYSKVVWWYPSKGDADPGTSAPSYDLCAKD